VTTPRTNAVGHIFEVRLIGGKHLGLVSSPGVLSVTAEEDFAAHFADDEIKDSPATQASKLMPGMQGTDGNLPDTSVLGLPPRGDADGVVA